MIFKTVPFHETAAYIAKNINRFYDGMADANPYGAPNIDWNFAFQASAAGQLWSVVAADDDGIAGISIWQLTENPRHKHILEASCFGVFVEPRKRGKLSITLMQRAEDVMKDMGAHEITYVVSNPKIEKILSRSGYAPSYRVWSKRI